jgi:flagellar biosynthesis chaperone FliJ
MSNQPTLSDPTAVQRLHELNDEIPRLEAEAAQLQKDRAAAARKTGRLRRRWRYLQIVRRLRRPAARFELWPTGVMVVGPLLTGIVLLVLANLIFDSFLIMLLAFFLGVAIGAGACTSLLYRPPDALLPAAIEETDAQLHVAEVRLEEAVAEVTEASQRLRDLVKERRELVVTDKLQRAMLLQRKWKTMDEAEWKDYVVEVLRTLGAKVERQGELGEHGIDMIVTLHGRRIAIQAHGKGQNVNSAIVHEALAAKSTCRCDACAVIVNRRFSGAAIDDADRFGCTLVSVNKFPDFVLGKIEL